MDKVYEFSGIHIIADLYDINQEILNDLDMLVSCMSKGITKSNTTSCGTLVKKFLPSGLTILNLLEESHISIHTYPENNSMFLDIFTCGKSCFPEKILDEIMIVTKPKKTNIKKINRGECNL